MTERPEQRYPLALVSVHRFDQDARQSTDAAELVCCCGGRAPLRRETLERSACAIWRGKCADCGRTWRCALAERVAEGWYIEADPAESGGEVVPKKTPPQRR